MGERYDGMGRRVDACRMELGDETTWGDWDGVLHVVEPGTNGGVIETA